MDHLSSDDLRFFAALDGIASSDPELNGAIMDLLLGFRMEAIRFVEESRKIDKFVQSRGFLVAASV